MYLKQAVLSGIFFHVLYNELNFPVSENNFDLFKELITNNQVANLNQIFDRVSPFVIKSLLPLYHAFTYKGQTTSLKLAFFKSIITCFIGVFLEDPVERKFYAFFQNHRLAGMLQAFDEANKDYSPPQLTHTLIYKVQELLTPESSQPSKSKKR